MTRTVDSMSAMTAVTTLRPLLLVMYIACPTDNNWDGNIVISDIKESNRERKVESRMLPYQQPTTQTGHTIA